MQVKSINHYVIYVTLMVMGLLVSSQANARELPDFTELVEKNSAAVVNISTKQKVKRHHGMPPGMEMPDLPEGSPWGDLFRHFFGDPDKGDDEGNGTPDEFSTQSLGSGFIIDQDGYVITNYHCRA